MNPTYIHLLITHFAVYGALFGFLVLIGGIWKKDKGVLTAAYTLFILSAIGATIAYYTGEPAEETVEKIQGISEAVIEEHEDSAMFAFITMLVLGASSVAGIYINVKNTYYKSLAGFILFVSLVSFAMAARTGYLGGKIRHTEVHGGTVAQPAADSHVEGEHEED